MERDREERIRARAYDIWEREGQQEGSHLAHWEQAEKEIRAEEAQGQDQLADGNAPPPGADSSEASSELPGNVREGTADAPTKAGRNNKKM